MDEGDLSVLVDKFIDESYGDMINYVAFASYVDPTPPEAKFDPYALC